MTFWRNPLQHFAAAGRALKSRNYRLFFTGQIISLTGNWMTSMATSWLVYRVTRDPQMLGFVTFMGQFPAVFVAPIAGVFIDRWDLRKTLLVTQFFSMLQSFALAYAASRPVITVHELALLYLVQGIINGVDIPARQTIVSQLVTDPADVGNAIALNSSLFNLARLIGPSIAGFVIAAWGEKVCFLIDGISYLAAIAAVYAMHLAVRNREARRQHVWKELREGLSYMITFPPMREILMLCAVVSLFGIPTQVLMPVFATDLLHGGPKTQGMLMAGIGIGAVAGALVLASRRTVVGLGRWMAMTGVGFAIMITLFGLSRNVWLSIVLMGGVGWCLVILNASGNTLVQTIADEDKRGRALSLLMMCYLGLVPVGGLLMGAMAQPTRLGAMHSVMLGGLCTGAASLIFWRRLPMIRRHVRPILEARGILRPIAEGLEAQGELSAAPQQAS